MANRSTASTIDEYIAEFPPEVQLVLQQLRAIIRAAAPNAWETLSYAMPTFDLNGHLVHFAGFKGHIGFYPTPSGVEAFKEELTGFKMAKGSVQFPLGQPLPEDLIRRIVAFRVAESTRRSPKADLPPAAGLLPNLASPARRALAQAGITQLEQLAAMHEADILRLHGMGPKAVDQLRSALAAKGLSFAKEG